MPDKFRPEPGKTLEIDLAYFDSGSGDIALDYDSTDIRAPLGGAYKRYPHTVHRMGSGQWKLAHFYVNDAGFEHLENGGADFRFNNEGSDLSISGVEVQRVNREYEFLPLKDEPATVRAYCHLPTVPEVTVHSQAAN